MTLMCCNCSGMEDH